MPTTQGDLAAKSVSLKRTYKMVLIEYYKKVNSQLWKENLVWACMLVMSMFLLNFSGYTNVTWTAEGVHRLHCQSLYIWGELPVSRCWHSRSATTLQSRLRLIHCSWWAQSSRTSKYPNQLFQICTAVLTRLCFMGTAVVFQVPFEWEFLLFQSNKKY